jgi:hypothetical protein
LLIKKKIMKKTQETQERQETHGVVHRILLFFFTLTNCVLNFLLNQTASKNTRNTRNAYKISRFPLVFFTNGEEWWVSGTHLTQETRYIETPHFIGLFGSILRSLDFSWCGEPVEPQAPFGSCPQDRRQDG